MKFGICTCFLNTHIFLQKYKLHVIFRNKETFYKDYKKILIDKGCRTEEDFQNVFVDIEKEINRRKKQDNDSYHRGLFIQDNYKPLYDHIYQLKDENLSNNFVQLISTASNKDCSIDDILSHMEKVKGVEKVYRFPVFTSDFIELFNGELDNFLSSEMPRKPPNTMSYSGMLLGELGMDHNLFGPLVTRWLTILTARIYPEWTGDRLDSHRAFTVEYGEDKDVDLACHYDNAEVTLNLCLRGNFTGGSLFFGGMKDDTPLSPVEVDHRVGWAILHRGQHMHGALPVESGTRRNLVIWMRSSSARSLMCPRCSSTPVLMPSRGMGDGFLLS